MLLKLTMLCVMCAYSAAFLLAATMTGDFQDSSRHQQYYYEEDSGENASNISTSDSETEKHIQKKAKQSTETDSILSIEPEINTELIKDLFEGKIRSLEDIDLINISNFNASLNVLRESSNDGDIAGQIDVLRRNNILEKSLDRKIKIKNLQKLKEYFKKCAKEYRDFSAQEAAKLDENEED